MNRFATESDYKLCAHLNRQFGTTYYFATLSFPPEARKRTHAVYGFVRVPDEWVDNPGEKSVDEVAHLLDDYEEQLVAGLEGTCPTYPTLRAFCDVARETDVPLNEAHLFLEAMRQDLTVRRYETFAELDAYMRGSAASVGLMMCSVLDVPIDPEVCDRASDLGNAMQLTNFLRDIAEDLRRGRIYLPQEDMRRFGVSEEDLENGVVTEPFKNLMKFEISRARELYGRSDVGIRQLPPMARRPVMMARVLYSRILDRIEANGFDVFGRRARTSRFEKLWVAGGVLLRP